jgi:hypothetical protein
VRLYLSSFRYRAEGVAYRTLHDGQVLLVNGPDTAIV